MTLEPELPEPLTPRDCDLRSFPWYRNEFNEFRRSRFWLACKSNPAIGFYLHNLMSASFHEVPSSSVEDDDIIMADMAMCSPEKWPEVKSAVLASWIKCSDGRLYSPFMAKIAENCRQNKAAGQDRTRGANDARKRIQAEKAAATSTLNLRDDDVTSTPRSLEEKTREEKTRDAVLPLRDNTAPAPPAGGISILGSDDPRSATLLDFPLVAVKKRATKPKSPVHEADFERFWGAYPRKVGKKAARKAWEYAVLRVSADQIYDALTAQRFPPEERYQPHPATWLNDERWLDETASSDLGLRARGVGRSGKPEAFAHVPMSPAALYLKRYRAGEIDEAGNELRPAAAAANDQNSKIIEGELA